MSAQTNQHALGLHITDAAVKIAELFPSGQSFTLSAFGEKELPPNVVIDGAIIDPKTLGGVIRQIIEKPQFGHFTTNFVVCSLPESRIFLKIITLPHFPKKQLAEAIAWEARSTLPIQQDRAYYQTETLGEHEQNVDVLLSATEKSLVDGYIETLRQTGLTPIAFDLEGYATARTIREEDIAQKILIQAHIGFKVTMLTVLRFGQVWFSHALPVGVDALTREFAEELHVPLTDARGLREKEGLARVKAEKTLKAIADGIISTVKFCEEQFGHDGEHIDKVALTGSFVNLPHLVERLAQFLPNRTVAIATARLDFSHDPQPAVRSISPLLICIGLALRGAHPARWARDLNFLPETYITNLILEEIGKQKTTVLRILGYVSLVTALLLGMALWMIIGENAQKDRQVASRKLVLANHPAKEVVKTVEQTNTILQRLSDLEAKRIPWGTLLRHIAEHVPERIVLNALEYQDVGKKMAVSGVAPNRAYVLAFAQTLSEDKAIRAIAVPFTSFDKAIDTEFTITFVIDEQKL